MISTLDRRGRRARRFAFSSALGDGTSSLERRQLAVAIISGTTTNSLFTRSHTHATPNRDDPATANDPEVDDDNTALAGGEGATESSQSEVTDSYGNLYQSSGQVTNNLYDPSNNPPPNGGQTVQIDVSHQHIEHALDRQGSIMRQGSGTTTYADSGHNSDGTLSTLGYSIGDSLGGTIGGETVYVHFTASFETDATGGEIPAAVPVILQFGLGSTFANINWNADANMFTAVNNMTGATTNSTDPSQFEFDMSYIIPTGTTTLPFGIAYSSMLETGINQTYDADIEDGDIDYTSTSHFNFNFSVSLTS